MAKTLRQKVIEFRARYGMTQKEFAEMCSVHPLTICNLEKGKRLRPTTVALIAMKMNEHSGNMESVEE